MWHPEPGDEGRRIPRRQRLVRSYDMTVCIAAISDVDNAIVTVSDMMLSNDGISSDHPLYSKRDVLGPHYRWCMYFAGDPSVRLDVARRVNDALKDADHAVPAVAQAVEAAFRDVLKLKVEGEILSRLGVDRDRFWREGRQACGDSLFVQIAQQVRAAKLSTTFLLAGFEPNGRPRMFVVEDPGVVRHCEQDGFAAIGNGETAALCALNTSYRPRLSVAELVYRACEAKFLAEKAAGVGPRTLVTIFHQDGRSHMLSKRARGDIRRMWERNPWTPLPKRVSAVVKDGLEEIRWIHDGKVFQSALA